MAQAPLLPPLVEAVAADADAGQGVHAGDRGAAAALGQLVPRPLCGGAGAAGGADPPAPRLGDEPVAAIISGTRLHPATTGEHTRQQPAHSCLLFGKLVSNGLSSAQGRALGFHIGFWSVDLIQIQ